MNFDPRKGGGQVKMPCSETHFCESNYYKVLHTYHILIRDYQGSVLTQKQAFLSLFKFIYLTQTFPKKEGKKKKTDRKERKN